VALPPDARVVLHYLGGKVEADLLFGVSTDLTELSKKCAAITANDPYFLSISLYQSSAP
jgi:hypothetical protein